MKTTLFIHPRKGLYRITSCSSCGHLMECKNCSAPLVSYKQSMGRLELICHQCQSFYDYPKNCPSCGLDKLFSKAPGIDQLEEFLLEELDLESIRLDKNKTDSVFIEQGKVYLSTRIYDPLLDYTKFERIIFVQAENLLADIDYTTQEETMKALVEVFIKITAECELIFDTKNPNLEFFQDLQVLFEGKSQLDPFSWYLGFLKKELDKRQKFKFPPFYNLFLLTSQEKNLQKAKQAVENAKIRIEAELGDELKFVDITDPYPARFLKRKGMYSFHLLLKISKTKAELDIHRLKKVLKGVVGDFRLQIRLNPRHLF
jgi:primosomal protein N' (replication factor Y)